MKAVIVTGGKQYTVAEGDVLFIEKLNAEENAVVKFDEVLAVLDGENSKIGAPVVEGAAVEAKVVKNGKGKKIDVIKYKAKKGVKNNECIRKIGISSTGIDCTKESVQQIRWLQLQKLRRYSWRFKALFGKSECNSKS